MSDTSATPDRECDDARTYFASLKGLAYYIATWSYLWIVPPVATSQREWLWLSAAVLLAALWSFRPSLRFLWRRTDWFRIATVVLILDSATFSLAALWPHRQTLLLTPFFATFGVIVIAWPAMKRFAERYRLSA